MKKHSVLRVISFVTAILITAGSLFACKPADGGAGGKNGLEKVTLEHVYRVNYLDAELDRNTWIQSAMSVGEDTYLTASYYKEIFIPAEEVETIEPEDGAVDGTVEASGADSADTEAAADTETDANAEAETNAESKIAVDDVAPDAEVSEAEGTYDYENGIRLLKVTPDGSITNVKDFVNVYKNDEQAQRATFVNYSSVVPLADGRIWALVNDGFDDWSDPQNYQYESKNRLVLMAPDGTEEKGFDVQEALKATLSPEEAEKNRSVYIERFFIAPDGSIIVYGSNLIAVLDENGQLLRHSKFAEDMWISSFVQLRGGDIVGMSYSYDSTSMTDTRRLVRINAETAELEEIGDMPFANAYNIFPSGEEGKVFVTNQSSLFLYDLVTTELTEEVNWLNSDLNGNRVSVLAGLPDGGVLISENSRNYDSMKLALLTENPAGDSVEKYVINFASVYLDDNMTEAIISFNKQNDEYRIVYNDYSVYNTEDDYEAGIKQLNNDIIAGKIPDIFSLQGLEFDIYASKGLLYDINKLMEADEGFNRADYFENVLDATSVGGKLYSIIPNFSIRTVIGKSSVVGDRMSWTMEDLKAVTAQYPDAVVFGSTVKSDVLKNFVQLTLDKYIDSESFSCSFDSPEFISVLELINSFPEEIDWNSYYEDMTEADYTKQELQYYENRTLLAVVYLSRFYYPYQARMFGEEVSYIGFPVPEGTGSAIEPTTELAVSSKSKGIDIAWQFIKFLLSEEYQKDISYGFSVNRRVTENMAAEALAEADKRRAELAQQEANGVTEYLGGAVTEVMYSSGGSRIVSTKPAVNTSDSADGEESDQDILNKLYQQRLLTQKDIDSMMALIESVDSVARANAEVEKIITEEAAAYFSGQKSAAEVAKTIQSKVFLYVSEGV